MNNRSGTVGCWKAELNRAKSHVGVLRACTRICRSLGLKHVTYASATIRDRGEDNPILLTSFPQKWVDLYFEQNYQEIDPVLMLASASVLPINWMKVSRRSNRVRQFFGEAENAGVGTTGVTICIFGPNGKSALFTATADLSEPEWRAKYPQVEKDITYLSHLVHDRIMALDSYRVDHDLQDLSLMERSCLQWTADGYTMKGVAKKLNVSERAVRMYLSSARNKLNAKNTIHAVALMMRRGQLA